MYDVMSIVSLSLYYY